MRKAVVTVEALRCHECQMLIDPVEGQYFRRQMKTAVDVGHRHGPVARYEMVNICPPCHQRIEALEAVEGQRRWWFRFWCIASVLWLLTAPYSYIPMIGAIVWRVVWKKRHVTKPAHIAEPLAQEALR